MPKRKKLGKSLIVMGISFTIAICLGLGSVGLYIYYRGIVSLYQRYIDSILLSTSYELNPDDLDTCIQTLQESEQFQKTQTYLDYVRDHSDISYIYIIKPVSDGDTVKIMDVMAGVAEDEKNDTDNVYLGEISDDSNEPDIVANYVAAMDSQEIIHYNNYSNFGCMYSGLLSIRNSKGDSVAVLAVDMDLTDMLKNMLTSANRVLIAGLFLAILFLIGMYLWLKRRIIVPIERLAHSARYFVRNSREEDESSELQYIDPGITSGDEIQRLSDAFRDLTGDISRYMDKLTSETKERSRIASELNIATQIQASMLPCIFPPFPERTDFDVYATMDPAKEVGGDFYDFFMVDENHVAVVMADVSGKGVPAALFMVIGKTLLKDYSSFGNSLGEVFTKVNDLLCESNKEALFITAFEGILDLRTGEFEFVNAGHEKPIIYRKEENRWEVYPTKAAFVLAGMEGMKYRSGSLNLKKGDKVFLYTDGIPEAVNKAEEQYGMDRLVQALTKNSDTELSELLKKIRADVDTFTDGAEQFDDITMLCMEYKDV